MVTGRSTEPRTIPALTKTSASTAVTGPAGTFLKLDVGRSITGTGVPAGTTIAAVASDTAATLSAAATATNTAAAVIGGVGSMDATTRQAGFFGWSPESDAEANTYSVAATNAGSITPDRMTDNSTPFGSKRRSRT